MIPYMQISYVQSIWKIFFRRLFEFKFNNFYIVEIGNFQKPEF